MGSLSPSLIILLVLLIINLVIASDEALQASTWLIEAANARHTGCSKNLSICKRLEKRGGSKPSVPQDWRCCGNRCVDVIKDQNNCGRCGARCPFALECCDGMCVDANIEPFHCGRCFNRCPAGTLCLYGMCGYAAYAPAPASPPPTS